MSNLTKEQNRIFKMLKKDIPPNESITISLKYTSGKGQTTSVAFGLDEDTLPAIKAYLELVTENFKAMELK